ncbi:MAG: hypothetical protein COZ06_18080 [Armatimonadetes bacterium CG_4_10_14_3_um_filter_66_18]|nr:hypothetical protein [Armatimonadota bacterium]OIP11741.1 MAG: hypothetical protein AUJ96_01860 [Armatimonadetes bacterium CG2_30_66_41]PIU94670.1 MAG: hypothetical protein COS65_06395 [Armatimonadetes bacterium CG06_land_8_20_14_3_00_66_21]PIX36971.1 MAG: hypothetical protein COZ57_36735 [Armatimonadetes bacterium CG_4_8_14_3_um_filter_66_20]PIY47107.1 MAG: hypothetical protein COZ06_18080 [Armatimonadetes bacterium CG_4_10_14_3_um_filter_66_18]PIZ41979.1 MAG: hypothetical protein COY42_18
MAALLALLAFAPVAECERTKPASRDAPVRLAQEAVGRWTLRYVDLTDTPHGGTVQDYASYEGTWSPTWSPDGRRLLYWRFAQGPRDVLEQLDVVTLRTKTLLEVSRKQGFSVACAPDDGRIAYVVRESANYDQLAELWVSDAKMKDRTLVAHIPFAAMLRWSPDGRWLAWLHRWHGPASIRALDTRAREEPAPTELTRLSPEAPYLYHFCWASDGKGVYFMDRPLAATGDDLFYVDLASHARRQVCQERVAWAVFAARVTQLFPVASEGRVYVAAQYTGLCGLLDRDDGPGPDIVSVDLRRGVVEHVCPTFHRTSSLAPNGREVIYLNPQAGTLLWLPALDWSREDAKIIRKLEESELALIRFPSFDLDAAKRIGAPTWSPDGRRVLVQFGNRFIVLTRVNR